MSKCEKFVYTISFDLISVYIIYIGENKFNFQKKKLAPTQYILDLSINY